MSRLLPAHTQEAREMAHALFANLAEAGLEVANVFPGRDGPLAMLAYALDYDDLSEFRDKLKSAHRPVYLNLNDEIVFERAYDSLSKNLGEFFGHRSLHPTIAFALQKSGACVAPADRRTLKRIATPWGLTRTSVPIAAGLYRVTTRSGGGLVLSSDRQAQMPDHLTVVQPYYDDRVDGPLVVVAFPEYFSKITLMKSIARLGLYCEFSLPMEHESCSEDLPPGNYTHPHDDPCNRKATAGELQVVEYLRECVYLNRSPSFMPDTPITTLPLKKWSELMSAVPCLEGRWPKSIAPWKEYWSLRYRRHEFLDNFDEHFSDQR